MNLKKLTHEERLALAVKLNGEKQLGSGALASMRPADIVKARQEGRFDALMSGTDLTAVEESLEEASKSTGADQGARGEYGRMPDELTVEQRNRWIARQRLRGKTADEVVAMRKRGDLDDLLRGEA